VSGANLIGRWTKTLSDTSNFKLQLYYDRTHRVIPNTFSESLDTYDVEFQHRFTAGTRHDVLWGVNYRLNHDSVVNSAGLAFLPPVLTTRLFSAFIQDELALLENRLKLTLGTKLEHNDFSGFEYQPSVRLALRVTADRTAWAAVSRAVRTPSRIDRDFFVPSFLAGGPGFDSEKLIAYELGLREQPRENVSFSAAAFFHDYDDLRSLELTRPRVLANGLAGEAYGVEIAGTDQVFPRWRLAGGYTFLQLHLHKKPGSTDVTSEAQEGDSPRHQILARSSMDIGERFQWDATARYVERLQNQRIPSYSELDLRVAYLPGHNLELSVIGRNLLHNHHPEFGGPATRRELQRSVAGKITWSH
jgi:iron complex outermembrane receptor protein